jgi:hypothetical protein
MKKKAKKMTPDMVAKRKKSMLANVAQKTMSGNYSR